MKARLASRLAAFGRSRALPASDASLVGSAFALVVLPMEVKRDPLAHTVLGAAIAVHKALGPGLFESVYRDCLALELADIPAVRVAREVALPVTYRGVRIDRGFRLDFVIDDRLVIEIKSVENLLPVHSAQVITYLKLSGLHQGLLINFNVTRLMDGVKSFLN